MACDAGGARALPTARRGRGWPGLEAVLADGTVVGACTACSRTTPARPAVAADRQRGHPRRHHRGALAAGGAAAARGAALIPLASLDDAEPLLRRAATRLPSLEAADFFPDDGLSLVLDHLVAGRRCPARARLRGAGVRRGRRPDRSWPAALEAAGIEDAVVADDTASRERLWQLREAHTEAIAAAGVPHKIDVGVPLAALADSGRRCRGRGGRAADPLRPPGRRERARERARPRSGGRDGGCGRHGAGRRAGGTISAEHGVGVAKAALPGSAPAGEIAAMRAVKRALDPDGLLNPGAVLSAANVNGGWVGRRGSRPQRLDPYASGG